MSRWKQNMYVCLFGSFASSAALSLVLPFLPLYIEQLGIHDISGIEQWSGAAFGATFLMSAIIAPFWGKLADQHGRKLMLIRASSGMTIILTMMGFVHNVYELTALRHLMGAISGYYPSAVALVATQTPKENSGGAMGMLSTGYVSGSLLGPLIGGWLAELVGLRHVFYFTGQFMFLCFLVSTIFVREQFSPQKGALLSNRQV